MTALCFFVFFCTDTLSSEIYTLSLHDALPIFPGVGPRTAQKLLKEFGSVAKIRQAGVEKLSEIISRKSAEKILRSEEHTSELQSHSDLVCRLLLEKKKKKPSTLISRLTTNTQA